MSYPILRNKEYNAKHTLPYPREQPMETTPDPSQPAESRQCNKNILLGENPLDFWLGPPEFWPSVTYDAKTFTNIVAKLSSV